MSIQQVKGFHRGSSNRMSITRTSTLKIYAYVHEGDYRLRFLPLLSPLCNDFMTAAFWRFLFFTFAFV